MSIWDSCARLLHGVHPRSIFGRPPDGMPLDALERGYGRQVTPFGSGGCFRSLGGISPEVTEGKPRRELREWRGFGCG